MDKQSFADINTAAGRLDLYLQSDGTQLPKDWRTYKSEKKGLCLFCDSPNSYFKVQKYQFGQPRSSGVDTGTLACSRCTSHVRRMEDSLPGLSNRSNVPEDLVEVEDIIDSYIFRGELPEGWASYLLHGQGGRKNRCFFCAGGIDPTNIMELTLPVTHSVYLTGGRVHTCQSCFSMYMHMSREIDVSKDECYNCGTHYVIDDQEYVYRRKGKTMSHHSCPECSEVLVVRTGRAQPTDEGHLRNRIDSCCYCKIDIATDLTISELLTDGRRLVKSGYVCDGCLLEPEKVDFYKLLNGKPLGVKVGSKRVVYVYPLNEERYLVRQVLTDKSGSSWIPVEKKNLINILLEND